MIISLFKSESGGEFVNSSLMLQRKGKLFVGYFIKGWGNLRMGYIRDETPGSFRNTVNLVINKI